MSNKIITVENLGKMYRISHRGRGYQTIRDRILSIPSRLKGNNLKHEEFWALKDVSFEIETGDRVGIIGRNGAGKSTLLKLLSRITKPSNGRAVINGRVASLLEVGTGFHPELSGRENIFMNGALLGMTRSEIRGKFDEIVDFAEVEKFIDTPVKRYSSGMYVRLAFAVAAHLEPEILLVDEVLAVGDAQFQKKCLGKMEDVSKSEGRTVLFVSHNMGAIHELCLKCILLDSGNILKMGETHQIVQYYLDGGLSHISEYTSDSDQSKPIHLRKVYMQNNTEQNTNEFSFDQPFKIIIEYEVNKAIEGCFVWLGIQSSEHVFAFGTSDTDANKELLNKREIGYYHSEVHIPEKWLNSGSYSLIVGITRFGQSFDRIEAGSFNILDIGVPERGRPGILQPFLNWNITRK